MLNGRKHLKNLGFNEKFFLKLAPQSSLWALSLLYFSPRKLPITAERLSFWASRYQKLSKLILNDSTYDLNH
jgi:hypothetical protein